MASEGPVIIEAQAEFKKKAGKISLQKTRCRWVSSSSSSDQIVIPIQSIKSQLVNTPKDSIPVEQRKYLVKIVLLPPKPNDPESNYTFQFPSLTDREAFKDALAGLLAAVKSEPEQASQATPTVNTTHLTPEEAKMRQKILETNSDLNKLFRDLVQGGIIKEEEFWENRKQLLLSESLAASQRKGTTSSFLEDIRPQQMDQDFKISLTAEKIRAIFAQNPGVEKAYQELVPDKMKEAEFWKKYFLSKYFHRKRAGQSSSSSTADKNDVFQKVLDKYMEEEEADAEPSPKRLKLDHEVNKFIDLATTTEDISDRNGTTPDSTMRPGGVRAALPLIRKFNRLSEMVLKNTINQPKESSTSSSAAAPSSAKTSTTTTGKRSREQEITEQEEREIILEDLAPEAPMQPVPLTISDQSRYFEAQAAVGTASVTSSPAKKSSRSTASTKKTDISKFVQTVENWEGDLTKRPPPKRDTAQTNTNLSTLQSLTKVIYEQQSSDSAPPSVSLSLNPSHKPRLFSSMSSFSNIASIPTSSISPAILLRTSQLSSAANELLRHFWGCFPYDDADVSRKTKLERMYMAILNSRQSIRDYVEELANANASGDTKMVDQVELLMKGTILAMQKAVEKYNRSL